jgi:hypothetical protein
LRKRAVIFRCGETVTRIDVADSPQRKALVSLDSGKRVAADVILFSIGRVGATKHLGLPVVGIQPDKRGRLTVDDRYRTSVPNIYAAGDVIGYPALAATSSEQGRIAACQMFGAAAEPMASHFPVGIYTIPEISMVGATEQELTQKKVPYETGVARYSEISRGQILGDHSGMFKLIFHRDTRQLLGCHCIGSGATELIHTGQAVLGLGGGLDYFLTTVFNFPTLAECYKVAAHNAASKLALEQIAEPQTSHRDRPAPADFLPSAGLGAPIALASRRDRSAPAGPGSAADDNAQLMADTAKDWKWAYKELRAGRFGTYRGVHVAVFEERVIGSDANAIDLIERMCAMTGLDPARIVVLYVDP